MRDILQQAFTAAVQAAMPRDMLAGHLPTPEQLREYRRVLVVGAGKAGGSMALAFEDYWLASGLPPEDLQGLVVTRYHHALPAKCLRVVEASHPVPDQAGAQAAQDMLEMASSLGEQDLLIMLLSGGGSSLLCLPPQGVSLDDMVSLTRGLLASGAPIQEMNIVRKHVSRIQGGRLAQATKAKILCLVISDVPGDEISAIASGPTEPDPSSYEQALDVIRRWNVATPAPVLRHLQRGAGLAVLEPDGSHLARPDETPKPGDAVFSRVETRLIATASQSLSRAAALLREKGFQTLVLGDAIAGEARDVAQVMAAIAKEADVRGVQSLGLASNRPLALISGGECTVTIKSRPAGANPAADQALAPKPRGGRCSEFLLALAIEMESVANVWALAADTDGIDGSEQNAGALMTPDTLKRARALDMSARARLEQHDSWGFFDALGDLVTTGPTYTNVNDFRVILLV